MIARRIDNAVGCNRQIFQRTRVCLKQAQVVLAIDGITHTVLDALVFPVQATAEGRGRHILAQCNIRAQDKMLVAVIADLIKLLGIHN